MRLLCVNRSSEAKFGLSITCIFSEESFFHYKRPVSLFFDKVKVAFVQTEIYDLLLCFKVFCLFGCLESRMNSLPDSKR
jgi:hypothetical protein